MMTLNNIKGLFENIASSHYNIEGFGFGNIFEINGEIKPGLTFPLLWLVPRSATTTENTQQRSLGLMIVDRVKKDKSNRDEVWSDTEQTINDVIKILKNESDDYNLVNEPEITYFDEQHADWVAGCQVDIVLESDFNNNYCDIPSANISSPVAVPGYGIIKDQHGNIVTTLRRGEVYYIEILETIEQTLGTVTPTIIQVIS